MGTPQKVPPRRTRRARALLAVARGQPFTEAARQAGLRSGSTVAALVQRFNQRGMPALSIAAQDPD